MVLSKFAISFVVTYIPQSQYSSSNRSSLALFEASGCPFTPEDQKISQSKFKNFISHLIASRNKFNLDNIVILKLAISFAFTEIGLPDPENFLDNACEEELITNFQDGFSKGDITHAAKSSLKHPCHLLITLKSLSSTL